MSKLRKVSPKRALACLLALFALLTVFTALAETQAEEPAQAAEQVEQVAEEAAATAEEGNTDPDINFLKGLSNIAKSTGIAKSMDGTGGDWRNYVMIAVACFLLYLAIVKQFEPPARWATRCKPPTAACCTTCTRASSWASTRR